MLTDDLENSIEHMKELRQLEETARDEKAQAALDKSFTDTVNENHKIVLNMNKAMDDLRFKPSQTLKNQLKEILTESGNAAGVSAGPVQKSTIRFLTARTKEMKETIAAEWADFYAETAERRIQTLMTVKSITQDPTRTGYVISKIKQGEKFPYGDIKPMRLMAEGVKEADITLNSLGLTDDILAFLNKVSRGSATLDDLTDTVVQWIRDENMTDKFNVTFGTKHT